jgi:putative SOS response-associated peptidase YedK
MCGRLTQQLTSDEIARLFGAQVAFDDPGGHFNVAPTQPIRAIVEADHQRILTAFRWGLIPSWADSPKIGAQMINARAETVAEKPAFRSTFKRQRCIVPADAFYEWRRSGTTKTPFAITRRDGKLLALAGLWSNWRDKATDERIQSCTIVTTSANSVVAQLHDRMPVILPEDAWEAWLDPENQDTEFLRSLLVPRPDDELTAYQVSRLVNDVRHDGPELLHPVASLTP